MKSIKKNVIIFGFFLTLIIPLKSETDFSPSEKVIGCVVTAACVYGIGSLSSFLTRYCVSQKFNDDFSLLKKYERYETDEETKNNLKKKLNEKINVDHAVYSSLSRRHHDRPLLYYEEYTSDKITLLWFLKLFNMHSKDARQETNYLISQLTKLKKIVISMDRYWQERQSLKLRR